MMVVVIVGQLGLKMMVVVVKKQILKMVLVFSLKMMKAMLDMNIDVL